MNLALWLWRAAARNPDNPALFYGTEMVATYAEFQQSAARLGQGLQDWGVKRGDRVVIFMANSVEYLQLLYGIWSAGAVAVPVNAKLHPLEAAWIIENADAALVVCDAERMDGLRQPTMHLGCTLMEVSGPQYAQITSARPLFAPVQLDDTDLSWLFYTSGTTGTPKGVALSCGNIRSMALSYFADVDDVSSQDASLYAAPMSHGAGLYNVIFVQRGARHVVPVSGGFDAAEVLDLAAQTGRVSMFAAPTMVRRLIDHARATGQDGSGLQTIVYAGGPMYEADILDAVDVLGPRFVQIYGQGECPMGITALPRHDIADRTQTDWRARLNSVGRAQSAVDVRILGPDGAALPDGQTGEIVVKGATVMTGYWRNPSATAETLRDGWLHTGDLGKMDAQGYVTLQDRSKDMIISGGSNIYPREVEEVLLAHPAVREAAVIGLQHTEWGEIVVACVALHAGQTVSEADLDALCLARIARFKRPKIYQFLSELPKNNYGKTEKRVLRARLESAGQPHE